MAQPSRTITVLHVDDEPAFAELTAAYLARQADEFQVETAVSASDAMDVLNRTPIDCIVSDYNMPGPDGLEFLEAVRADHPELPFILFTGHGSEAVASDAISAGVTDYMQKGAGPDQFEVLAQRIKNVVARHRVRDVESRSQAILEASPAAIVVEVGREIVYANPAAVALAGAETADALMGLDVAALTGPDDLDDVLVDIEAVESGGRTLDGVRRELRTLTGEALTAEVTARPVTWEGESGHVVIIRDVTDLVASRAALESSEARFRNIAESATDAIVTIDSESRIRFANQAVERVFGYPPETLLGQRITALMPEELREVHLAAVEEYLESGEPTLDWSDVRLPGRHRDGHEIDLHVSFAEYKSENQRRFTGVIRDVTDAETGQPESAPEGWPRSLFEKSTDGLLLVDSHGGVLAATPRARANLGDENGELVGRRLGDFPSADTAAIRSRLGALGRGETATLEGLHGQGDGSSDPVDIHVTRLERDDRRQFLGIVRDGSTDEESSRELERYETIIEALGDPVYALDADGCYTFVNDAFIAETGYSRAEIIGEHASTVVPAEYVEKGRQIIDELLSAEGDRTATWELERRTADGELVPAENHAALLPSEGGRFHGTAGVIRDITERKQREEQLERERNRMRFALASTNSYIFEIDPATGAETRFGEWEAIHGVSAADLPTTDDFVEQAVHPDDRAAHRRAHQQLLDGDEAATAVEYRTNPDTGIERWIRAEIHRDGGDPDGPYRLVGLATDITARKEHEQHLERERDRLDAFARVVSHDLRNPLTVARGRLELAIEDGDHEHLAAVDQQLDRMETLIEDLLVVARDGSSVENREPVELAAIVPDCWASVETGSATLDVRTDRTVRGERSRLRQVFENLIRNAVEHGGDVAVTVGALDDGFFVEDDGPGIPAADRERVFDAGYSKDDNGTGFGLNIVREIVEAHGWSIDATEGSDGGARFEVTGINPT